MSSANADTNADTDTPTSFEGRRDEGLVSEVDTEIVYFAENVYDEAVDYRVTKVLLLRDKVTGEYYVALDPETDKYKLITVFNDETHEMFRGRKATRFDGNYHALKYNFALEKDDVKPLSYFGEAYESDGITFHLENVCTGRVR